MSFKRELVGDIQVWTGDPDCASLVGALQSHLDRSAVPRLPPAEELTNAQVGSLGEALAFLVGRASSFPDSSHRVLADNCANPLAGGSKTGLDVLWIAFHPTDASLDHAWIQEVKTTTSVTSASYLSELKTDYRKLFSMDLGLTLEARLGDAAFRLEHMAAQPALALRARALGARSISEANRISLVPTGVHDLAVEAVTVLEEVRITLVDELGWSDSQIMPLLIAVSELGHRLRSIAFP